MKNVLTVRDLRNFLQTVPDDLPVEMAMNGEYQWYAATVMRVTDTVEGEITSDYVLITDDPYDPLYYII